MESDYLEVSRRDHVLFILFQLRNSVILLLNDQLLFLAFLLCGEFLVLKFFKHRQVVGDCIQKLLVAALRLLIAQDDIIPLLFEILLSSLLLE